MEDYVTLDYETIGAHTLYHGNCLEVIPQIGLTVDMVLADPPYGTTACTWDTIIPLEALWAALRNVVRARRAIVMTASQPFTSVLVCSNIRGFHHDWVWKKSRVTGVLNAKRQPLRTKEDVLVFADEPPLYNPQGLKDCHRQVTTGVAKSGKQGEATGRIVQTETARYTQTKTGYPRNVLVIPSASGTVHPTQKPVALMEYLIRTYTNEGDTVLDFTMGSGTTGVACQNTGRKFVGIELDAAYFDIACDRVEAACAETI